MAYSFTKICTKLHSKTLHSSCIAINDKGVLILGQSGSGKSSLALKLITLGARLVSDDKTIVEKQGDRIIAKCPKRLWGLLEARGTGILKLPFDKSTTLNFVVNLNKTEKMRLPFKKNYSLLDVDLKLINNSKADIFAESIYMACLYELT